MTKKAKEDGGKGTPKTTVGNNCPRLPKPPNTAKAIADKAGHRAAGTHPRARGSTRFRQNCQNLLIGTAHPRARGTTAGTAPAIRQHPSPIRSITMVVTGGSENLFSVHSIRSHRHPSLEPQGILPVKNRMLRRILTHHNPSFFGHADSHRPYAGAEQAASSII
jgi:hypothetical protein